METRGRSKTERRYGRVVVVGLTGLVGVLCGTAIQFWPSARLAIRRDPISAVARKPGLTCPGGLNYPAAVELLPDAVITESGREAVEYHAEIKVERGKNVGLAWTADVIDDRGRVVASKLSVGASSGKAGDTKVTNAILAQSLPDGFYKVRARVAVSPEDEPAMVMEAVQAVRVDGGRWREMTADAWRNESSAKLAVAVSEPVKAVR